MAACAAARMSALPVAPERHARNPFADFRVSSRTRAVSGGKHARSRHRSIRSGGNSIYRPGLCARRGWRGNIRRGRGRRHRRCGRSHGHRRWNSQPFRHGPGSAAGSGNRANQCGGNPECSDASGSNCPDGDFTERAAVARLCLERPSPTACAGRSARRRKLAGRDQGIGQGDRSQALDLSRLLGPPWFVPERCSCPIPAVAREYRLVPMFRREPVC